MTTTNTHPKRRLFIIFSGIALLSVIFAALLWLDLSNQGLAWRLFRSQTGEESPVGQIRGMVELGGNLIRTQPQTAATVPIQHTDDVPYGINTFLHLETEIPKLETMLGMIADGGFVWLRQEFPWEDLEVDGRGQFTDTRNDIDGDGERDTIDAWAKYDRIVDLVDENDLKLMVRLSNPPPWSRADNPDTAGGSVAPPDDLQDYVDFAVAVAERYKGRITHYQIWNEPNIYPEWGEDFADPAAYTDMLCQTYDALKAVDPQIVVLSAALAPTISLDGFFGYQDVIYLQNMYDNGAGACFDILSAQGYGLFSGATDRRLRLTTVNVNRHVYYRDLMVANGDAHKPVWISEAAWNPVLDAELPPEEIGDYSRFGEATDAQSATWTPELYQRAAEEWSWVGNIAYWFFTRPDDSEVGQSYYYFRMVEPDYSPERGTFTPLPVYDAMKAYIDAQYETPVLYRGTHQATSWEMAYPDKREIVQRDESIYGDIISTNALDVTTYGTVTRLKIRTDEAVTVMIDDETMIEILPKDTFQTVTLYSSTMAEKHAFSITSDDDFEIESVTVYEQTWQNLAPVLALALTLGLMIELTLMLALWRRFTRTSVRTQPAASLSEHVSHA
ncbi:MAG: hypothetical protein ACPG7F_10920 [Aggregatilineales bacterium]